MNNLFKLISFCSCLFFVQPAFSQTNITTFFCPPCGMDCDKIVHHQSGKCKHCGMELVVRTEKEQLAIIEKREKNRHTIAVFIHDGMEILDFAGPVEVFTTSGFKVVTVGVTKEPIISQGVVKITPEYSLDDCPKTDMIAVFGGNSGNASKNPKTINWLKKRAPETDLIYSVCTGAFFLAEAGLLDGLEVTTFHSALDNLQKKAPKAVVLRDVKYVDSGKIICAAGVSSGIDGALYLVERLMGKEVAQETADYIEYENYPAKTGKGKEK